MSDDEINAVIGEQLGDFHHSFGEDRQCKDCYSFEHEDKFNHCPLKDARNYAGDLNAMHEAKKSLPNDKGTEYHSILIELCGGLSGAIEATARQRAIAFIKTVCPEKWKGDA